MQCCAVPCCAEGNAWKGMQGMVSHGVPQWRLPACSHMRKCVAKDLSRKQLGMLNAGPTPAIPCRPPGSYGVEAAYLA
jgi:hypothetical protein